MPALGYPRQKSWSPECLVYSGFIAITIYFISLQAHMSQYFIKCPFWYLEAKCNIKLILVIFLPGFYLKCQKYTVVR